MLKSTAGILQAVSAIAAGFTSWDQHQRRIEGLSRLSEAEANARAQADEAEFALIQAKKSKLSAQQRRNVCYRVELRRSLLEYYAANHRPDADDLDVDPVVLDCGTGTREEV